MAGLSVDVNDYINYYAARDPYRPVLQAAASRSWVQLSKCLPQTVLRSDEWYNDYAVKAGIGDIIGTRLFDSPSCTVILSAHWGIYQAPVMATATASLRELLIRSAMRPGCMPSFASWVGSRPLRCGHSTRSP